MAERRPDRFNCNEQGAASWLVRAETCSDLLARLPVSKDRAASLADIGCGDQKLRTVLRQRGLSIGYHGYDLHPQSGDVTPFDVRTQTLPRQHTVAVLLGVTEYLPELAAILRRLAQEVPCLLLSHVVREHSKYSTERLASLGWLNHLTTTELGKLLHDVGLKVMDSQSTPDRRTLLVLCARHDRVSAG